MLVWQLRWGHQQQLQGEANAKDTRQENVLRSPRKVEGFIFPPQSRPMDLFPNEAFDLFIFSLTTRKLLLTALGTEELPETAKLSSQHGTSVDKRCPSFASCQLPGGEEEEEDVSEQVAMWGFIQSLQCSMGLTFCLSGLLYLLRHFLWHPKTSLDVARCKANMLNLSLPCCCFFLFATCAIFVHCWFETQGGEQAMPSQCSCRQEQESSFHTLW